MQSKTRPMWIEAGIAVANWPEIDIQHIENQFFLTLQKNTNHTREDLLRLHLMSMQFGQVYVSASQSQYVHAGCYACGNCHKAFVMKRKSHLHDCHTCENNQFYRLHEQTLDLQTYH